MNFQSFSKALARVMGNGGSSLSQAGSQGGLDEDDLNDVDAFHASVLMVPDEVKPRGKLFIHFNVVTAFITLC